MLVGLRGLPVRSVKSGIDSKSWRPLAPRPLASWHFRQCFRNSSMADGDVPEGRSADGLGRRAEAGSSVLATREATAPHSKIKSKADLVCVATPRPDGALFDGSSASPAIGNTAQVSPGSFKESRAEYPQIHLFPFSGAGAGNPTRTRPKAAARDRCPSQQASRNRGRLFRYNDKGLDRGPRPGSTHCEREPSGLGEKISRHCSGGVMRATGHFRRLVSMAMGGLPAILLAVGIG